MHLPWHLRRFPCSNRHGDSERPPQKEKSELASLHSPSHAFRRCWKSPMASGQAISRARALHRSFAVKPITKTGRQTGKPEIQYLWALPQPSPREKRSTVKRGCHHTSPPTSPPHPAPHEHALLHVRGLASSHTQSAVRGCLSQWADPPLVRIPCRHS
jgi:hypothetical protein